MSNTGTLAPPVTVEHFERLSAASHERMELIRGRVVTMSPAGLHHGVVTSRLSRIIASHAWEHDLGEVTAAETGFRLLLPGDNPAESTVRAPDIGFLRKERVAEAMTPSFCTLPPDLAVETLSPGDAAGAVSSKVAWWLACGTPEVWTVDAGNRTLTRHLPDRTSRLWTREESFDAAPVMPGLRVELAEIFAFPGG